MLGRNLLCPPTLTPRRKTMRAIYRRSRMPGFVHPDVPGDWPRDLVGDGYARDLEGQLYLAMVIAFVPDHVLEHEDRVIVVEVHLLARFEPAPDRFADGLGALGQHLCDTVGVALVGPLLIWYWCGELGYVLFDEDEPDIVDVSEEFGDGWAVLHRFEFKAAVWKSAQQVDEDGVVPVPGIEQGLYDALV